MRDECKGKGGIEVVKQHTASNREDTKGDKRAFVAGFIHQNPKWHTKGKRTKGGNSANKPDMPLQKAVVFQKHPKIKTQSITNISDKEI